MCEESSLTLSCFHFLIAGFIRRTICNEITLVVSKCLIDDYSKLFLVEEMGMLDVIVRNAQMGQKRGLDEDQNHCKGLLNCLHSCASALLTQVNYDDVDRRTYESLKNIFSKLGDMDSTSRESCALTPTY